MVDFFSDVYDFFLDIDWSLFANLLVGVGTIALAIVAVFQQNIHNWLNKPKLNIEVTGQPPDCHKMPLSVMQPFPLQQPILIQTDEGYYYRIRVVNTGRDRAENAEVFIASVSKKVGDGYEKVEQFLPMNLLWSHVERPFLEAISPGGMEKHCNFGYVIPPEDMPERVTSWLDVPRDETIFTLALEVHPNTLSNMLTSGEYRIDILIAAANMKKPKKKTLEMNISGQWYGDESEMLSNGISFRML